MITEFDLELSDGRTLRAYDSGGGPRGADELVVYWHHGTPGDGAPPANLLAMSEQRRIRWIGHDRAGYPPSSRLDGRSVAAVADDVAAVADYLQIDAFAVVGLSGGGPHALACAALLPDRIGAVATFASIAPDPLTLTGPAEADWDWLAGMYPGGATELAAAREGGQALAAHLADADFDPEALTARDLAALRDDLGWLGQSGDTAMARGGTGMLDDDLAFVAPWGFDPADITTPQLIVQGGADRVVPPSHGAWLARHQATAELWVSPPDSHLSILQRLPSVLDWLRLQQYLAHR